MIIYDSLSTITKKKTKLNIMESSSSTSNLNNGRVTEIVFFDLETTVPNRTGQKFRVLEFGAIVVCPRKLVELESYCTLIRPQDLSEVALKSTRCNGITRDVVANAPSFEEVADKIFSILNGRIWAGHNIQRFDCVRIKEAFAEIGRAAPVPVGIIDSLGVLTEKFGKRAGNMKMATLAAYFGLGQQKHRSLEDVRMNLEVLKHCATVLLLESSLPSAFNGEWQSNLGVTTRSKSLQQSGIQTGDLKDKWNKSLESTSGRFNSGKSICREEITNRKSPPSSSLSYKKAVPYGRESLGKMTLGVRKLLSNARSPRINNLLKHSHSLLI